MKTIFDNRTAAELIERIRSLDTAAKAQWGSMTLYQMLKHCCMNEEMLLGKTTYQRLFIGRLFGKMALKGMMKDDAPLQKNSPTHPELKIKGSGDVEAQRHRWIALLQEYSRYPPQGFLHPFFGAMTWEEVGRSVYKHSDHHLRQFGA